MKRDYYCRIEWPSTDVMHLYATAISDRYPQLPNAFGFVDGTRMKIRRPANPITQARYYNAKDKTNVACVLTFAPDGTIINAHLNHAGSEHDVTAARKLYPLLRTTADDYYLLGDQGFKMTSNLLSPIRWNQRVTVAEHAAWDKLKGSHKAARQAAEWGMRQFKLNNILNTILPFDTLYLYEIMDVAAHLVNFRARVGYSEIRAVYWNSASQQQLEDIELHAD